MNESELKEKLLKLNILNNNEFLNKYVKLICHPNNDLSLIMESHHIIPVCYFRHLNLDIDNSIDNLISLDIKNHILAHYYLSMCSNEDWFFYANSLCVSLISHRKFNEVDENWINEHLNKINEMHNHQRYLSSKLQIGLHQGENNENSKYSLDICNGIKYLLLEGFTNQEIQNKLNVPNYLIKRIRCGKHWSCKEDNFKLSSNKTKEIKEYKFTTNWLKEEHYCKNCNKRLTIYLKSSLGDGLFCSTHCAQSWSAIKKFKEHPEIKKKIMESRRSYEGNNNPNYGKKASKEVREKMSIKLKNSPGVKNSSRFTGHHHSEESRKKISDSLKMSHLYKGSIDKLNEEE